MCQNDLPSGALVNSCTNCGADLSRLMPKAPKLPALQLPQADPAEAATEPNLGLGILGAFAGAIVGAVLMFGFFLITGFRFPLMGVGTGLLTGLAAKWLNKGADEKLGMISAGIAMTAVIGTLYLMYHEFPILNIISVIVSISVAYRIASN
jgi:hypothetical protein